MKVVAQGHSLKPPKSAQQKDPEQHLDYTAPKTEETFLGRIVTRGD
jgi:hypothetical protein